MSGVLFEMSICIIYIWWCRLVSRRKYYFILAGRYEITSIFLDAILEYIKVCAFVFILMNIFNS